MLALSVRCSRGDGWDILQGDTRGQEEGGIMGHLCEGPWPTAQWTWVRQWFLTCGL